MRETRNTWLIFPWSWRRGRSFARSCTAPPFTSFCSLLHPKGLRQFASGSSLDNSLCPPWLSSHHFPFQPECCQTGSMEPSPTPATWDSIVALLKMSDAPWSSWDQERRDLGLLFEYPRFPSAASLKQACSSYGRSSPQLLHCFEPCMVPPVYLNLYNSTRPVKIDLLSCSSKNANTTVKIESKITLNQFWH